MATTLLVNTLWVGRHTTSQLSTPIVWSCELRSNVLTVLMFGSMTLASNNTSTVELISTLASVSRVHSKINCTLFFAASLPVWCYFECDKRTRKRWSILCLKSTSHIHIINKLFPTLDLHNRKLRMINSRVWLKVSIIHQNWWVIRFSSTLHCHFNCSW